ARAHGAPRSRADRPRRCCARPRSPPRRSTAIARAAPTARAGRRALRVRRRPAGASTTPCPRRTTARRRSATAPAAARPRRGSPRGREAALRSGARTWLFSLRPGQRQVEADSRADPLAAVDAQRSLVQGDDAAEPLALARRGLEVVARLGAVEAAFAQKQQLEVALERRQRRAQVVRDVGEEVALLALLGGERARLREDAIAHRLDADREA